MKTVVKSDMVAHLWANQSQEYARNSSGSMSFRGRTLYSYATPIGRIVDATDGSPVALMTTARYSVTTSSKHDPAMRSAVTHLPSFRVPALGVSGGYHRESLGDMHAANLAALIARYEALVGTLMRAQSEPYSLDKLSERLAAEFAEEPQRYAHTFGLPVPARDTDADAVRIRERFARLATKRADPKYQAKLERDRATREARRTEQEKRDREARDAERARYAAERAERERIEALELPEKIRLWRAGEISTGSLSYLARGEFAMLRVNGDTVQTSLGAEVPVADAARACVFVAALRKRGESWQRNGTQFPVGQFQLDSVSVDGTVRAGCHTIAWEEVERLAPQVGVTIA